MRRFWKWCGGTALMVAALVLIAEDGRGQQFQMRPAGGPGGGAPTMDPDAMFNAMAKGQNQINLNDPANAWMKGMRERRGQAIPPNGIITREMFKTEFQQQMAQGGGFGGKGGGGFGGKGDRGGFGGKGDRGGFGGPPGMTPGGPVVIQGGPGGFVPGAGGAPGADQNQMFDSMFQRADKNGDGKITPDEASDRLRGAFAQYDKNGDGALDATEFRAYMAERMAGGGGGPGGGRGGPGGLGGPMGGNQFQPGAFPQPAWQGGPMPGGDFNPNREDRPNKDKRRGGDDDEDARPVVHRYGKLPKELPGWFEQLDTDKDGMVGLYEWRRDKRKTEAFVEMDLNGDGYLTADEWLRYSRAQLEKKPGDDDEEGGGAPTISRFAPMGDGAKGGNQFKMEFSKGKGGDMKGGGPPGFGGKGGGDKGGREKGGKGGEKEKGGGKRNPFTGG